MITYIALSCLTFLCTFILQSVDQETIVQLQPPLITPDTIAQKIVCTRPMREGKFNISIETRDNHTIVNCNGHGGSGWTTLFGWINYALDLFAKTKTDKNIPIRVIGSGCMGLTAAIELTRAGYNVAGIYTKDRFDLASWRAAGYFGLVSIKTADNEQETLNQIGMDTFKTYQSIEQGTHPYISNKAVNNIPVYCSVDTEAGVEDLEARGLIPTREYVTLDFGNGIIHPGYVKYLTYFMNTTTLMRELIAHVERLEIPLVIKEINSYDEIEEPVIFNCAGMGGRELNSDDSMIPVRGHLVTLNEEAGSAHMAYMIYTKVMQDGDEEYIYLFPKNSSVTPENTDGVSCAGVLGGSFIPHVDKLSVAEQIELDNAEFKRMLDRNCLFFNGHLFNTETYLKRA